MGLSDTIFFATDHLKCAHGHELREFQTKQLENDLSAYYVIGGQLYRQQDRARRHSVPAPPPAYHRDGRDRILLTEDRVCPASAGELVIYAACHQCDPVLVEAADGPFGHLREVAPWVQHIVRFDGGRLVEIRPDRVESRDDVRRKHPDAIPDDDRLAARYFKRRSEEARSTEQAAAGKLGPPDESPRVQALLERIKARLPQLLEVLATANDHWGHEDGVYRFYHQSFKVYGLQEHSRRMVEALDELGEPSISNEWFRSIVSEGTGKVFSDAHNRNWLAVTRPIVEAFFHARYFLEMACRYGRTLRYAPSTMPSGWAALLHLYGLR
jgi:hypothetical protein